MHETPNLISIPDNSWRDPCKENVDMWMYRCSKQSGVKTSRMSTLLNEIRIITQHHRTRGIVVLFVFNLTSCVFLMLLCNRTQSIALQAYTYTVSFNLASLLTCILTLWVEKKKPSPVFTFGYERFEVLAVFASTILAQLGSMFIVKESFERLILEQPVILIDSLPLGTGIAFITHVIVLYGCRNSALEHVIEASSSSWLQEHVSDISQSICSIVPPLSNLLLPRVNPMLLIACGGAISLLGVHLLIELRSYYMVDTLVAVCIAAMMCATMLPMSIYSGKILLQTTPSHMVGQLDKCLRETLTIDGVLEFRNEHFWTLSFGKMAGSLQVRVRRDANEQLVLAHVVDRLSNLISVLTVQVFKDEWLLRRNIAPTGVTSVNMPSSIHENHNQDVMITSVSSPTVAQNTSHSSISGYTNKQISQENTVNPYQYFENSNNRPIPQPFVNSDSWPSSVKGPVTNNYSNHYSSSPAFSTSNQYSENTIPKQNFVRNTLYTTTSAQSQNKNLLLSGTRTLDSDRFNNYKPR